MLSYLSKKIAVPHNLAVEVVSWNAGQGWLAIGGENGFLKVLKLDGSTTDDSSSNNNNDFSSTQTLEGHQHSIRVIVWNENFRKLTTSDAKGLIIVWSMNQGAWFEEMVNNRNRSVVTDMRWSKDGQRICIVYEDGAVIVGTVDGQRLWGKEIDKKLSQVEWLPDCKGLIFGTFDGEIQIYDSEGIFSHRVHAACLDSNQAPRIQPSKQVAPPNIGIASIEWWGSSDVTEKHAALAAAESAARMIGERHLVSCAPNLCIAFRNGKAQLMRGIQDDQPILLDTGINILGAEWSPSGHTIAIAGISVSPRLGPSSYATMSATFASHHLFCTECSFNGLRSLSWEGSGARIALAVDSYIYLSTINNFLDLLAIMEKSRMYILRSMKPEEPVTSEAYIYEFSDLQIKGIVLDNLLRPMHSSSTSQKPVDRIKDVVEGSDAFAGTVPGNWQNHLVICDTKTLRDTRDMLSKLSNMKDAFSYVEANPHKRLWRLLAESALEKSDVSVAEKAFVKLSSYSEIRLCRRLEDLDGSVKRLAEISAVYFRSFDNAEALYLEIDRHDLAVDLRLKLGDWFRVVQLLQPDDTSRVGYPEDGNSTRKPGSSPRFGSQKNLLKQAYVECGNYYAKRGRWNLAAQIMGKHTSMWSLHRYTALEDFDSLYQTISHETDSAIHLRRDVARALLSIGHVERAVNLLVGLGDIPTAVEECIISNHWSKALELAADHKLLEVDKLLGKYAVHFVENHQIFSAVELYHRAGKHVEAAQLLGPYEVGRSRGHIAPSKGSILGAGFCNLHEISTERSSYGCDIKMSSLGVFGQQSARVLARFATNLPHGVSLRVNQFSR
ncbi:wd-repeat protein, putative, partial [Perkinsus marinus ATCC 50983]